MPANPNSPFGFREIGLIPGSPPNFGTRKGLIANASTTAMFYGDPLLPQSAGYYGLATVTGNTGAAIGGIAVGFSWFSLTQGKHVWSKYWPGTGVAETNADIEVDICANPHQLFEVQCLLGPIAQASVGSYANFAVGAGGRTFGAGNQSSYSLDDGTINATAGALPFEIYQLPVPGPLAAQYAQAGYDATQPYNRVWVRMANLVQ